MIQTKVGKGALMREFDVLNYSIPCTEMVLSKTTVLELE